MYRFRFRFWPIADTTESQLARQARVAEEDTIARRLADLEFKVDALREVAVEGHYKARELWNEKEAKRKVRADRNGTRVPIGATVRKNETWLGTVVVVCDAGFVVDYGGNLQLWMPADVVLESLPKAGE